MVSGVIIEIQTKTHTHKAVKSCQKTLKEYMKAKHDVNFFNQCKQERFFQNLSDGKTLNPKIRSNEIAIYRNLNDAINKRRKELNLLKKEHDYSKEKLLSSIT